MRSLVLNRGFVGRPHSWHTRSCPQCGVSWGRLSQTLTVQPFSTGVYPDGKSPALTFTRPPATLSVGRHPLLVFPVLSAMRSSTPGFRGCAPMMGAAVVVRNAELHPGLSWVCTNDGCIWGCPQCGVGPGPRFLWVRCWSSSGGRVRRCMRAYSTSGTRLSSRSRHRRCCWPRNLCGPSLTGRGPPGGSAGVFMGVHQ